MSGAFVIVHPLVLLSAVDHYKRKGTKRVVGILLGTAEKEIHISESFAAIFEEDAEGWFLDTSHIQNMYDLFYKVNRKLEIVGWYHTGPKMSEADLEITKSLTRFVADPFMVIINVHLDTSDLPVQTFRLEKNDFVHVNSSIEAEEAEEVGVEHLVRDIREEASGSISARVKEIKESMVIYERVLEEIGTYLGDVLEGRIALNQEVIDLCQEIINSTPRITRPINETLCDCYSAELAKAVVALNDLRRNRIENDNKIGEAR
jgi:26S proteasome regulatory subunit N8